MTNANAPVYLLVFAAALTTSLLLTPAVRLLAQRWGFLAEPGGRRRHIGHIPKLGGLPLFIAWLVGVAIIYVFLPPVEPDDATRLQGLLLGSLVVVAGGLLDLVRRGQRRGAV